MEVHAPEHPVHTWKDFFRHIAIVTVGILIALSLEGMLEWRHHRSIARQARENIMREIADNQQRLGAIKSAQERVARETDEVLAFIAGVIAKKENPERKVGFYFPLVQLSAASWNSAQATGALGYMEYAEVQQFATVYELQGQFSSVQQQLLRDSAAMSAVPSPSTATVRELEDWRHKILNGKASYHVELQLAEGLNEVYQQTLAGRGPPGQRPAAK
jgi:hypothetical protein